MCSPNADQTDKFFLQDREHRVPLWNVPVFFLLTWKQVIKATLGMIIFVDGHCHEEKPSRDWAVGEDPSPETVWLEVFCGYKFEEERAQIIGIKAADGGTSWSKMMHFLSCTLMATFIKLSSLLFWRTYTLGGFISHVCHDAWYTLGVWSVLFY